MKQTMISRCSLYFMMLACLVVTLAQAANRNVIVFIGDGMGHEHVQAGRLYRNGIDTLPLTFEKMSYKGQAITVLPNGTATDSATAGTALATGYQHPANGIISMGVNNSIKTTLLELAKARGLRIGIVTTDSISGATPAAFGAHEPDRTYEADIRYDYLMDDTTYPHAASLPNVLFGGGYNDPAIIAGPNATYVTIANNLGYSYVNSATSLSQLGLTVRALGLFGTSWTPMDSFVANNSTQPRLPQMVNKALALLHNDNNTGFFLMVEGALIDKLSHSNDRNFVPEVAQLDQAVEEAVAWSNQSGQPLLIIVTADHETGGVNVPDGQSITPGTIPSLAFSSTGHTVNQVPIYANWPAGLQNQTIDNTETFFIAEDYVEGGKPPVITDLNVINITEISATVQWNTTEPSDSRVLLSGISNPFVNSSRVTAHSLTCVNLQPGTVYSLEASSADLAGFVGTATKEFSTLAPSYHAIVNANPIVNLGVLTGNFEAIKTPNDGLAQTITEATDGVGSGLEVLYTLHTTAARSEIAALNIYGTVSWTLKDGTNDRLLTEIRVLAPDGVYVWEPITLDSQTPFLAEPAGSYVDASGNIVLRFTDSAAIKRERKDTVTLDHLVGIVQLAQQPPTTVTTPGNVTAVAGGASTVTLSWTDVGNETGYDIWRYTTAGGWAFVQTINANSTTFSDTGLKASTTYSYVVRAFNEGSYADSATATATTGAQALEMPENLTAKVGRGVITLTWTDTNASETGYLVYRAAGEGAMTLLKQMSVNSTSFADTSVTKGVTYRYQVRAVNATTQGPLSGEVSATAR